MANSSFVMIGRQTIAALLLIASISAASGCFAPIYFGEPIGPNAVVNYTVVPVSPTTRVITPREVTPSPGEVVGASPAAIVSAPTGTAVDVPWEDIHVPPAIPTAPVIVAPAPPHAPAEVTATPTVGDDPSVVLHSTLRAMARGEHSRGVELLSPLAEGAPSSSILFNLAVCQDRQGNRDEATRIYRLLIQDAEYGVYARARLLVLSGELGNDPTSEASERAREEFLAGMEHFQADRIREAIDAFERAYELVHHSRILFNLGVCYQRLGQTLTAASYYHLVLYEEPAEESTREQARLHLDQVLGVDGQIEGGRS